MLYILLVFLFIFGMAFGSFLNVVSLRYKPDQKLFDIKIIGGRSRCPVCKKQLVWYELIPLFSFLFQRGVCRHCGHKISLQYPLIEILSGLIFVFVPFYFATYGLQIAIYNLHWLLAVSCWVVIFLLFLLLAIIDFREYIIPDEINILLVIMGAILIFVGNPSSFDFSSSSYSFIGYYSMMFGSFGSIWANHIAAAIMSLVFFGIIIVLSRGKGMGMGDLKLAGALGFIFGWPDIVLSLCLAFITGALTSIILMVGQRKKIKDAVPFGPFLVIGSALVFFFGFQIVNLYFGIFSIYF